MGFRARRRDGDLRFHLGAQCEPRAARRGRALDRQKGNAELPLEWDLHAPQSIRLERLTAHDDGLGKLGLAEGPAADQLLDEARRP